ncbi:RsbT co-antagonist protein rsbRB [Alkalihalobacillus alcalophilus ATCC 27647 = CGMCC 1.3604]|uniref:Anti-anti-sigma regulatory factor n=1 Tax=Alkalihalobacillus alcalophilus ATCC 27647 = CGMCC 1.3604 TaxID=1218173 RepID=A0A094WM85_ALKAL|nr:STAS domain-containing protein [Alkalihalobacillus alcalophilus]KGA97976.1 anti-anti-sigma regulatory factor [Alkalihalobacillus alcalophilus ATCC 27647 = CGMCC 1.3604]MED1563978.1 STAS domain-containing protein [Alkalihalobacillus alcalophilus]THG89621.1 RsbT co-antagonist protein rsbRB [Alkalihalobacillus alcalophilus ATCC 27647 = CGMCC 1.3604]
MKTVYEFFKEQTWELTEAWYAALDKTQDGIYSTTDPNQIKRLKEQNYQFHLHFAELFNEETTKLNGEFDKWVDNIAKDQAHLNTPLDQIIGEFFNVQGQYIELIQDYIEGLDEKPSHKEAIKWTKLITNAFNKIVQEFSKRNIVESEKLLRSQQEMILELSSPVISIRKDVAILPLVGDIDTHRAQVIFDKTLAQCNELQVQNLVIDLSGVAIVDTMVASKIFQVIEGLQLIGTKASLSGIRPEIAQTAIQLGINFKSVETYSSLAQAFSAKNVFDA